MTTETNTRLNDLKAEAETMGISFHPSIGEEKLAEKIAEAKAEQNSGEPEVEAAPVKKKKSIAQIKKEASELIRIQITCMDPSKSEWEGELFSCGNRHIGTFTKYVPYGVAWHVPRIIFDMIKEKKCQIFKTTIDNRGNKSRTGKLINAYAVEMLEPLNKAELDDLAKRQAMANGTAGV